MIRALVRYANVPPSEVGNLSFSQAINLLKTDDPSDPHAGGRELSSPADLYRVMERLGWTPDQ